MTNGVQFRFTGKDNNDYTLKAVSNPEATKVIPYSISCDRCTPDTSLVEDGALQQPDS
ncbi:TPA: hypothetical protein ACX6SN_001074 [Photobacterium damselae]